MLSAIWRVSLALAAIAVIVMVVLILYRTHRERVQRQMMRRRERLLGVLLSWLAGETAEEEAHRMVSHAPDLAADLLIEIFELVRGADRARLAALAEQTTVPAHLRRLLKSHWRTERLKAAENLVWFASPETRDSLRGALDDDWAPVALAAAGALIALGEPVPAERLVRIGLRDGGIMRLEGVFKQVAATQGDELLAIASGRYLPNRARIAAINALALSGDYALVEPLCRFAFDPSAAVRAATIRTLGLIGHPAASAAVIALLSDPDWEVRAEAVEAAGRIGTPRALSRLPALLGDTEWRVRLSAAEALVSFGEAGIAALRSATNGVSDAARRTAWIVLAQHGHTA